MIEIQGFLCEFCAGAKRNRGTTFRRAHAARRHEEKCFFNPATRACVTCLHFIPSETLEDGDYTPRSCERGRDLEKDQFGEGGLTHNCPDWMGKDEGAEK